MISFFKAAVNHMDEETANQPRSPQTLDHGIADTVLGFESEQQAGHPKEASKLLNKSDRLAQEVRPRYHDQQRASVCALLRTKISCFPER